MGGGSYQINHVVNYQDTLLDLVFCNSVDEIEVLRCEVPLTAIDWYHEPVEIYFDVALPPIIQANLEKNFNFKKANFERLNEQLALYDWNQVFENCVCINSAVQTFYDILHSCFNSCVPIKKSKGNTHPP